MAYTINHKIRNRPGKKTGVSITIAILVIVSFVFFGKSLFGIIGPVLSPFMKVYRSVHGSLGKGMALLTPKTNLILENENLKNKLAELEAERASYASMIEENTLLREALLETEDGFLLASPISFPPQTPYDSVMIDRGTTDGVSEGDLVFLSERIVVGKIELASVNLSRVRLFSSAGERTEVVLERTGEVVVVEGQGGGEFKIELPKSFDIEAGDTFVLPGLPRMILGEAKSVNQNESSPFLEVYLELPVKISGISALYIKQ